MPDCQFFFCVHNAYNWHDMIKTPCCFHFTELFSFVDAPLASNNAARTTSAAYLLKVVHWYRCRGVFSWLLCPQV